MGQLVLISWKKDERVVLDWRGKAYVHFRGGKNLSASSV